MAALTYISLECGIAMQGQAPVGKGAFGQLRFMGLYFMNLYGMCWAEKCFKKKKSIVARCLVLSYTDKVSLKSEFQLCTE